MDQAFTVINGDAATPIVFSCDHASNVIPACCGDMGIPSKALNQHMAVDIGAADLTRALADKFDASAVLCGFSRLVADANRPMGDPAVAPVVSDGIAIPGNADLSCDALADRLSRTYIPYHAAVSEQVARVRRANSGRGLAFLAMHSFTPEMNGDARPWPVGVLYNADRRLAAPLMDELRALNVGPVGDNEPYSGVQFGYAMNRHARSQGLVHVEVEVRQDEIDTDTGVAKWAEILHLALKQCFEKMDVTDIDWF